MKNPTPSDIETRVNEQLQAAFRATRDRLGFGSDVQLANYLGMPTTYVHWLSLNRTWPMGWALKLAAAAGKHLGELLETTDKED